VTNCHARSEAWSRTFVGMSPQECQRIALAAADDAPAVARLICDFPGWQISFDPVGVWCAERKLSLTHLELHCARSLNELRTKLVKASQ
jgi:hypothetical protein